MMTVANCRNFREEIDEADLNQRLSTATVQHLGACPDCRTFHDERGGLRHLMSNLGTVTAPADFDFRLRARLSREKDSPRGIFAAGKFLIGSRALAVVALLLLIVGAGVIIRSRMSSSTSTAPGLASGPPPAVGTPRKEDKAPALAAVPTPTQAIGREPGSVAPKHRRAVRSPENDRQQVANAAPQNKEAVREASVSGPTVLNLNEPAGLVRVLIDGQSFRVSIDDGHGSSHTISVPAVSFGSERVGERGFSFAPVKSTKGVW